MEEEARRDLTDLAHKIEVEGEAAAWAAMSTDPWSAQYSVRKMAHSANCFSVAEAIRAIARKADHDI